VRENPILVDLIGNSGIDLESVSRHRTNNTSSTRYAWDKVNIHRPQAAGFTHRRLEAGWFCAWRL